MKFWFLNYGLKNRSGIHYRLTAGVSGRVVTSGQAIIFPGGRMKFLMCVAVQIVCIARVKIYCLFTCKS